VLTPFQASEKAFRLRQLDCYCEHDPQVACSHRYSLYKREKAAFVPRSTAANNALALPRGGYHLDPTDTAKLGVILAGTNAALTLMCSSRKLQVYGAPATPITELLALWQERMYFLLFWQHGNLLSKDRISRPPWVSLLFHGRQLIAYEWNDANRSSQDNVERKLTAFVSDFLSIQGHYAIQDNLE
jgi:hypothetical protein